MFTREQKRNLIVIAVLIIIVFLEIELFYRI